MLKGLKMLSLHRDRSQVSGSRGSTSFLPEEMKDIHPVEKGRRRSYSVEPSFI